MPTPRPPPERPHRLPHVPSQTQYVQKHIGHSSPPSTRTSFRPKLPHPQQEPMTQQGHRPLIPQVCLSRHKKGWWVVNKKTQQQLNPSPFLLQTKPSASVSWRNVANATNLHAESP